MSTHLDLSRRDTICAGATPSLPSAIAIVRVSGPRAHHICERIFKPHKSPQKPFVATLGNICDLDEGISILFPEGKSYTGEPSFELHLHGNPLITQQILSVLQNAGCRLAEPGEFSMRAVLSGKMDLCKAESVADLIAARSIEAAQIALRNVKGALSNALNPIRDCIIDALCEIEARLDFPDENIGEHRREELLLSMENAAQQLQKLLNSAQMGQKMVDGARIVLLGKPNAGKSTLLNKLLGENRALVHHLPGTTRDVLEASWTVNGIPVTLVDVAGIRDETEADTVEAMGIQKAQQELERADLVLHLQESPFLLEESSAQKLLVHTKSDLVETSARHPNQLYISAKNGDGIEELKNQIATLLGVNAASSSEAMLTRARQKQEVSQAHLSLVEAASALKRQDDDVLVASELRLAGAALDRLLGKTLGEDVLDLIFSRFCIGK